MSTLAEFMIVAGADNCPPMLNKPQYESWKSRMELYIQGKDNGRIILNSVENGPLVWPTIALENGNVTPKTYEELSDKEKLQADCDLKATNIVFKVLHRMSMLSLSITKLPQWHSCRLCLLHVILQPTINSDFLPIREIKPLLKMVKSSFSKFKEDKVRMMSVQVHKGMLQCTQPKRGRDAAWFKEKVLLVQAQAEGKELDEEQL
ncbi:hypothetical protein Tco_0140941, partial [Tanacetum coccineum]